MKRVTKLILLSIILGMLAVPSHAQKISHGESVRVAYPTATLINGQIGQILQHTDLLEKHGLKGEVQGFVYGPPMMEALVSDKVDVAFTSEVPATLPLARGHEAVIVATFGTVGRTAVLVLEHSPVRHMTDLRGKNVGVPFGSSSHRNLLAMLSKAGLTSGTNVQVFNIGPDELAPVLIKGGVDAIMAWDPAVEQYTREKGFRIVASELYYSVVLMNKSFINKHRKAAERFLSVLNEAVFFLATNKAEVNRWFGKVSRLDPEVIHFCSELNKNYSHVKTMCDVDIALMDDFLELLRQSARFTAEQKLVPLADISKAIDPQLRRGSEGCVDMQGYNSPEDVPDPKNE